MPDDKDDEDQEMVYTGTGLGHAPGDEPFEHSDGEFSNTRDQPTPHPHDPEADKNPQPRRSEE